MGLRHPEYPRTQEGFDLLAEVTDYRDNPDDNRVNYKVRLSAAAGEKARADLEEWIAHLPSASSASAEADEFVGAVRDSLTAATDPGADSED